MKKLSEIFDIYYPNTNIFYKNEPDINGINFVSAKASNNGIAGKVKFTNEFKISVEIRLAVFHNIEPQI